MSDPYKLNQAFGVAIGMPSISGPRTERRPRFESLTINGSRKNGSRENQH
jgi:hypothetical protein